MLQEALHRLYKFSCESIFEIKVAGRFTANLVRAAVKVHPEIAIKMFVPRLCQNIMDRASGTSFVMHHTSLTVITKPQVPAV